MEISSLQPLSVQPEPFIPTSEQSPPSGQQTSPAAVPGPDVVTIQPVTEDKSQNILNQQIRMALSETFAVNVVSATPAGYPENLSPVPLAGQILDTVRGLLSVSVDAPLADSPQNSSIDMARESVDQGVQNTQNLLSNLGALQGTIGEAVDQTRTLIHQGLDTMEANPQAVPADSTATSVTAVMAGIDKTQKTTLQIETADGDRVTVALSAHQSGFAGVLVSGDGSSTAAVYGKVGSSSAGLSFSVEGDLDKKELHAIARMIRKVVGIAERFFDGNILGAMKKAASLEFNSKQISGFSLDLSYEEARQAAVVSQTPQVVPFQSDQSIGGTPGAPVSTAPPAVSDAAVPAAAGTETAAPLDSPSATPAQGTGSDAPAPQDASATPAVPGTEPSSVPDAAAGSAAPQAPVGTSVLIMQFQQMVLEIQALGLFKEPKQAIHDMVEAVARHRYPQGHEDHPQANRVVRLLTALANTFLPS